MEIKYNKDEIIPMTVKQNSDMSISDELHSRPKAIIDVLNENKNDKEGLKVIKSELKKAGINTTREDEFKKDIQALSDVANKYDAISAKQISMPDPKMKFFESSKADGKLKEADPLDLDQSKDCSDDEDQKKRHFKQLKQDSDKENESESHINDGTTL